ncbi:hypothetical protein ZHAS_00018966 [Anopheles sinensis]|uniref:Uncharacterized protein n=1 Tax=Anopheles sinensis TaxID=74873 RepID=A0A084WL35_ANOSI|nr:hypothetical protein ZHAS_00018966 [Anopheles sinensis]
MGVDLLVHVPFGEAAIPVRKANLFTFGTSIPVSTSQPVTIGETIAACNHHHHHHHHHQCRVKNRPNRTSCVSHEMSLTAMATKITLECAYMLADTRA